MRTLINCLILIVFSFLLLPCSYAQDLQSVAPPEKSLSPSSSMHQFIQHALKREFIQAGKFIEFAASVSEIDRRDVIFDLGSKLNKILADPGSPELSQRIQGNLEDDLPSDNEYLFNGTDARGRPVIILLQKKELKSDSEQEGSESSVILWQIPKEEVSKIQELELPESSILPIQFLERHFGQYSTGGISLADLAILLLSILLVAFLGYALRLGLLRILRAVFRSKLGTFRSAAYPLQIVVSLWLLWVILPLISFSFTAMVIVNRLFIIASVLTSIWLVFSLTQSISLVVQRKLENDENERLAALVPLAFRIFNCIVLVIIFLIGLDAFGIDITTLIAGLGVGGIAIALASQKTIENLFGGVVLLLDQPVQVGQFGKYGDTMGLIEDIGLRSTRIRTINRTLVSIPNADFIQRQIENFALRDRILFHKTIGVLYETTPDQLRFLVSSIRKLLISMSNVDNDPARVRIVNFGAYSIDIEIFAYFKTADWAEYLAMQEDLILKLIDCVHEAGTDFAFPSSTVYLQRIKGMGTPPESVLSTVQSWKEEKRVPLPDYPETEAATFSDTLPYPPESSWANEKNPAFKPKKTRRKKT